MTRRVRAGGSERPARRGERVRYGLWVRLEWLLDPRAHFPEQRDGALVEDGVCVGSLTEKIGLSQPTVTVHMQALARAGLVTSRKIGNWVFYKPDRAGLARAIEMLTTRLHVGFG